jgi:hypothetical protein
MDVNGGFTASNMTPHGHLGSTIHCHPNAKINAPQLHRNKSLAGNVGDMSATRQNVSNFCPDRPILATWFLLCRHTFVLHFSDTDGPKTDDKKERTI